jgi:SAM-dependent MidA family methyltransferase
VNELETIIRDEIAREGPLPFARYMALALYHPTLGYYSGGGQGREPVGWAGDYVTSGDLHPLWGWCIARQLQQMWELLGCPSDFDVIEIGAGRGLLAREVWRYALTRAPQLAAALRYTLVDRATGTALHAARAARLASALADLGAPAGAVRWSETLPATPVIGCVVANELVDALPVHVVEAREGTLRELFVTVDPASGQLAEVAGSLSSPEVAGYLASFHVPWRTFPDGWRAEICLAAAPWMRQVAASLARGFALTLDYGDTARRLYTPERWRGTLAVYRQHHFDDRALVQPGRQDITAHVNFSALVQSGRGAGLRLAGLTTQAAFLLGLGIRDELEALAADRYPFADSERHTDRGQADYLRRASLRNAVAILLDPRGLGGFRVLVQQRSVPGAGKRLLGLRRA